MLIKLPRSNALLQHQMYLLRALVDDETRIIAGGMTKEVRSTTLEADGAVAEMVVREMAEGALQRSGAHCSVAVSGVAGPDGGSVSKPVGTVWLAIADRQGKTQAWCLHLQGDRDQVRRQTVLAALRALLDWVTQPQSV